MKYTSTTLKILFSRVLLIRREKLRIFERPSNSTRDEARVELLVIIIILFPHSLFTLTRAFSWFVNSATKMKKNE